MKDTERSLLPRCGLSELRTNEVLEPFFLQAKELQLSTTPRHTWNDVQQIITAGTIDQLKRHVEPQRIYAKEFGPVMRAKYGHCLLLSVF